MWMSSWSKLEKWLKTYGSNDFTLNPGSESDLLLSYNLIASYSKQLEGVHR